MNELNAVTCKKRKVCMWFKSETSGLYCCQGQVCQKWLGTGFAEPKCSTHLNIFGCNATTMTDTSNHRKAQQSKTKQIREYEYFKWHFLSLFNQSVDFPGVTQFRSVLPKMDYFKAAKTHTQHTATGSNTVLCHCAIISGAYWYWNS